jgi:hypothetical protein
LKIVSYIVSNAVVYTASLKLALEFLITVELFLVLTELAI